MNKKNFISLAIGLLSFTCLGQSFDSSKLDNYFDALDGNNKLMGSVAVLQENKIIYSKSIGFSDIERKSKADENSKYRIGSISKTFTAVLALKAIEEGKIEMNQTIDKYFSNIENADNITISHLLYHRSGIHNFTNNKDYLSWNTKAKTEKEMIDIIAKGGSDFKPGSRAKYSNSNYVLLTYILEKSFQDSYSFLLEKYITQPAGLKNTYFGAKISPDNNECKSYRFNENWQLQTETDTSIPLGAGGIVSTPSDLIQFSNALFSGRLIESESLEQMKKIKENFGIGLVQVPFYDKKGFGHTGGIDGFSSVFYHFPDGNVSYALTSNGSNISTNDVSIAVLSAVYGKSYTIPEFKAFNVKPEDLDKYIGIYSSSQIPLKITVSKDKNTLIAQASGQPAFILEATNKDEFKYDLAGIVLEFSPTDNKMILKQGGGQFMFTKE